MKGSICLVNQDLNITRLSTERIAKLVEVVRRVVPSITEEEAGTLSHDLSDLCDISRSHENRVAKIFDLTGPAHQQQLDELLSDLLYGDIVELEYHIASLKNTLPGILKRLDTK